MAFTFKRWIFGQFPEYFKMTDTYKNAQGEGFFERYTRLFDYELDDEVYPFIGKLSDLLSPDDIPYNLLSHLAFTLGRIPQIGDESVDRRLVKWANRLFQVKGTKLSYNMIAHALGLTIVSFDINIGDTEPTIYDRDPPEVIYDEEEPFTYDDGCAKCAAYNLVVDFNSQSFVQMEPILRSLICFIEPIDAKLGVITPSAGFDLLAETSPIDDSDPNYTPLMEEDPTDDNLQSELS